MHLTTFTDYSLRVLIYLAAVPQARATIAEVAQAFGISEHHLAKVVHLLGREGVLRNVRGKGGGLELARPASEINIGSVVRLTERSGVPAECFEPASNACAITNVCRLKQVLHEGVESFYRALEKYTLADLRISEQRLTSVLRRRP